MKKSLWDMILKVVIAVASAVAGVLGANAKVKNEVRHQDICFSCHSSIQKYLWRT